MRDIDYSLYLIADPAHCRHHAIDEVVSGAVENGVSAVQLRVKNRPSRDCIAFGKAVQECIRPHGIPFIINDHIDIALALNADGVHIGQRDMPFHLARTLMGPDKIVGLSIENLKQAKAAYSLDADYLGVGPIFETASKMDAAPPLGLKTLRQIAHDAPQPVIAIGGINKTNMAQIFDTGVAGVAMLSAICGALEPQAVTRTLRASLEQFHLTNE